MARDLEKMKEYQRKWYKANRKKVMAKAKAWYEANHKRAKETRKAYREANADRISETKKTWHKANRKRVSAKAKAWRKNNKERDAARKRAWSQANRERDAARKEAWYKANKKKLSKLANEKYKANRDHRRLQVKAWQKANSEIVFEYSRKRRAQKKNATVPLNEKEKEAMVVLERTRKKIQRQTGRKHHLDHIVPLDHGGIHHPCNLRVLDGSENSSKYNKITPEALALVGENYRLYYERIGPEKAEWFRDQIAAEIGLETANSLIGSERAAPPTVGTLEDLLT